MWRKRRKEEISLREVKSRVGSCVCERKGE
jgi:hypothetical protein